MMKDLHNNILLTEAIVPVVGPTGTTPVVSNVVDTNRFTKCEFAALFGAIGNGTFTVLVEDSPDNSTWTTVPPAELLGVVTPFVPVLNETWKIGYIGVNRYLRVTITPVANSASYYLSALWILSEGQRPPYSAQFN
jgi:hypothetical protein